MSNRTFTLYRLSFTSPIHIGTVRDDYGISKHTISSDAMYAAITATLSKSGIAIPSDGYLNCVISSLFPYCEKGTDDYFYFFPKPMAISTPENTGSVMLKKIKKLQWIESSVLQSLLNGNKINYGAGLNGEYLTNDTPIGAFMASRVVQRATVSRIGEDTRTFYMDRVFFAEGSGLFFIAEGDTKLIDEAMPLLGLEGIGTDRNVGNGQFKYEKTTISLNLPDNQEYSYILSTYIPESQNQLNSALDGRNVAYKLTRCGGWITTPPDLGKRKNAIYAFEAGSIFRQADSGTGAIVDLAPQNIGIMHPIWRCGKIISLPIIL